MPYRRCQVCCLRGLRTRAVCAFDQSVQPKRKAKVCGQSVRPKRALSGVRPTCAANNFCDQSVRPRRAAGVCCRGMWPKCHEMAAKVYVQSVRPKRVLSEREAAVRTAEVCECANYDKRSAQAPRRALRHKACRC
eukprot:6189992-Pleurochrysis_carterae.AAC.1